MTSQISKVISTTLTALSIILALPSAAILVSWNSLPSSILYPVKTGLEKTALALLPDTFIESTLRLKLIDRRTKEAAIAIIKSPSNTGVLRTILAEAKAAQVLTQRLDQSQQKSKASIQLAEKLHQTSDKLEEVKQSVSTISSSPFPSPLASPSPAADSQPTVFTSPAPPSVEPTPVVIAVTSATTEQTIISISNTQEQIEVIIEELEEEINQEQSEEEDHNFKKKKPGKDNHDKQKNNYSQDDDEKDHSQDEDED